MSLKPSDIRNMTDDEIRLKITSLEGELYKLRFELRAGRVEKPHKMNLTKKDIARCHTIIKERENATR